MFHSVITEGEIRLFVLTRAP